MKLLAIETATEACSAALLIDGEINERYELAPRKHAELILPMVDELLSAAGVNPGGLDAVVFGRGPGSFTGLRIAAGIVQGIALGADLPVVPVSTLAALAQGVMEQEDTNHVLAALDARMEEIYWGVYMRDNQGLADLLGKEQVSAPENIGEAEGGEWIGVGSGCDKYQEQLQQTLGGNLRRIVPDRHPHAAHIARLGAPAFVAGRVVEAHSVTPEYLRDQVAQKPALSK